MGCNVFHHICICGELEAGHLDPPIYHGNKLVLTDCDIVEELNGKTFDDLGTALQIRLKRAFVSRGRA